MVQGLSKVKQAQLKQEWKEADYRLIEKYHLDKGWCIRTMCEILEISRAAYYKWQKRKDRKPLDKDVSLEEAIKETAASNNRLFGVRKMVMALNRKGVRAGFKKVYRVMSRLDLLSVYRPKRKKYPKSAPEHTADNILHREFNASKPNDKWVTDITELKIPGTGQKLYISTIADLYDRSIVACHISTRNDAFLVDETLRKALAVNPGGCRIFHSDRGFQYTRPVFGNRLESLGIIQSMSRVSRCIDNGCEEGLQGILKDMQEILYPGISTVNEGIEAFEKTINYYMNEYPQERFGGLTAGEVREAALGTADPAQYPIKPNPRILKFWERVGKPKKNSSLA